MGGPTSVHRRRTNPAQRVTNNNNKEKEAMRLGGNGIGDTREAEGRQ